MEKTEFVYVILLYRNLEDARALIENLPKGRVLLVNAAPEEVPARMLAHETGCDFLQVCNLGYGAGNNAGIQYAMAHYDFDYLALMNPDILVEKWDTQALLPPQTPAVYGPVIHTLKGKKQNPAWVRRWDPGETLLYHGYYRDSRFLRALGHGLFRLGREGFLLLRGNKNARVYALHGSCLIFSKAALETGFTFDENMFLYGEEMYLARYMHKHGIPMRYTPALQILHKQEGSLKKSGVSRKIQERKSMCYYYRTYVKGTRA